MAAITPVDMSTAGTWIQLRNVSAQATTGQTDWVPVPAWAKSVSVLFNLTAVGGTSPSSTPSFLATQEGTTLDDGNTLAIFTGSAITAASQHRYQIGPGISGIANGTDSATADAFVSINGAPPRLLGVRILNDRTDADETYTYTLELALHPR